VNGKKREKGAGAIIPGSILNADHKAKWMFSQQNQK